jgi:hypothetical protein
MVSLWDDGRELQPGNVQEEDVHGVTEVLVDDLLTQEFTPVATTRRSYVSGSVPLIGSRKCIRKRTGHIARSVKGCAQYFM